MSIDGFYVTGGMGYNRLSWAPYGNPVTVLRYRVAVNTCVGPWTTTAEQYLDFLVPSSTGLVPKRVRIPLPDMVFLNAGILSGYINSCNIPDIRAQRSLPSSTTNTVWLLLNNTNEPRFIQALLSAGSVALGLHNNMVSANTVPQSIAIIDPSIAPLPEYDTFIDYEGLPGDVYQLQSDTVSTIKMAPGDYQTPVAIVHGNLLKEDGTPAVGVQVKVHAVPSTDPEPNVAAPLADPGWLRPVDYVGCIQQTITDEKGNFNLVCSRGLRLWLEISLTARGLAFDIPLTATHVDVNMLQEWRRTGMMGPYDRGMGAAIANLGGGNTDG